MRLQAAIDRVTVDRAAEIIDQTHGCADIIEVGTSLIKDYGLAGSVKVLKEKYPEQCILADIKTCDEVNMNSEKLMKQVEISLRSWDSLPFPH